MSSSAEKDESPHGFEAGLLPGVARALVRSLHVLYSRPQHVFRPARIQATHILKHHSELGSIRTAIKVLRSDGVRQLAAFVVPPLVANALVGVTLFGVYDSAQAALTAPPEGSLRREFAIGSLAGAVQSFVACPVDAVKAHVRFGSSGRQINFVDVLQRILRTKGVGGLYRGLGLTIMRDSVGYGAFFAAFELCKRDLTPRLAETPGGHVAAVLCAGAAAGLSYNLVNFPFELLDNVIVADRLAARHAVRKVFDKKTRWSSYVSISSCFRAVPSTAVGFLVYEFVKHYL